MSVSGGFWFLTWVSECEWRLLKFNVSEWVSRSLTHSRSLTLTHSWVFRTAAGAPFDTKETGTDSHSRSKINTEDVSNRDFIYSLFYFFYSSPSLYKYLHGCDSEEISTRKFSSSYRFERRMPRPNIEKWVRVVSPQLRTHSWRRRIVCARVSVSVRTVR